MDGELVPLNPVHFFQMSWDCPRAEKIEDLKGKKYLIPDTSSLLNEEHFADVFMGWNAKGLFFVIESKEKLVASYFPELDRGDAVELFIDTRDIKTSGYNTRFCHHFFFLPTPIEERQHGEITHFRSEDAHPLCDPDLLQSKTKMGKGWRLEIFLPKEVLHGYDPEQFNRLGLNFRIHRSVGGPEHFSASTSDFNNLEQPSLWSTIQLLSTSDT